MKTTFVTIALGAAAIALPTMDPAIAQTPPGQSGAAMRGGAAMQGQMGLAGKMGMQADLTRAQAQQQATMMFDRLDLNHDGTLTRAEAEQFVAQISAARGEDGNGKSGNRIERMVMRSMGDAQSISKAQFAAQALARFDAMDLNRDGVLTAAEREQARAARAAQGNPGQ